MSSNYNNFPTKFLRTKATDHPEWRNWAIQRSINAANVTKAQLIEFATEKSLDMTPVTPIETLTPITEPFVDEVEAKTDEPTIKTVRPSSNDAEALAQLIAKLAGSSVDEAKVESIVAKHISKALESVAMVTIKLERPDNTSKTIEGHKHPQFVNLLKACNSRLPSGHRPNVWISGPTGSGKTHAAHQVASALDLSFGFHGSMSMPHELVGFVDAAGTYHETQFVKAYRNGGVCLVDEVDAGESQALLALNAALANGSMSLPNGEMLERHKDFLCIAAGNTFGQGATAEYVGRTKIDAAFLSRFPVKFFWGYDVALEQAISGNKAWAERVQAARARAMAAGLKLIIDPRHSQAGAALIAAGFSEDEAADMTYLASVTPEQKRIVEGR